MLVKWALLLKSMRFRWSITDIKRPQLLIHHLICLCEWLWMSYTGFSPCEQQTQNNVCYLVRSAIYSWHVCFVCKCLENPCMIMTPISSTSMTEVSYISQILIRHIWMLIIDTNYWHKNLSKIIDSQIIFIKKRSVKCQLIAQCHSMSATGGPFY